MTEHAVQMPAPEPLEAADPPLVEPTQERTGWWSAGKRPVAALAIGLLVGGGIGAAVVAATTDPTQSEEYGALQDELDAAEKQVSTSEREAQDAADSARQMEDEVARRDAELDKREQDLTTQAAAVTAREKAVTAVETEIEANSIGQGTWTVGRDIAPGTYRTKEALTGECYWGIYRSGSNGSDIVDNDIPSGGFPTVQLSEGQDFENNGCGTFVKQ
jgi:hypothetical protein